MKIIDIHTHGIGGYDTRTTDVEHILRIAAMHGAQGVSEIIPTIYPATIKVMRDNMRVVKEAMERQKNIANSLLSPDNPPTPPLEKRGKGGFEKEGQGGITDPSLVTRYASLISGIHLEGPFLNISKCGSLNAMTFLDPSEYYLKELLEGFEDMVKIITIAPELNGAPGLIKKINDMGIIVSMGHSDATYAEAEAGFNAGAKGITHIFNAMRGIHHREPGIAGFGLMNRDVYIEVIADRHHLHPITIEFIFSIKNHDRIILISDSVKETKTRMRHVMHIPAREAMMGKTPGVTDAHGKLLGGSLTVSEAAKGLIEAGFDEGAVMECITENPERYINV